MLLLGPIVSAIGGYVGWSGRHSPDVLNIGE